MTGAGAPKSGRPAVYGDTAVANAAYYLVDGKLAVHPEGQPARNSVLTRFGAQGPRTASSGKELLLNLSSFSSCRTTVRGFDRVRPRPG